MAENFTIDLGKLGKIVYYFEEGLCEKVACLSPVNEVKYEHLYHYDNAGGLSRKGQASIFMKAIS